MSISRSLQKSLGIFCAVLVISLFTAGGCSDNNGGGNTVDPAGADALLVGGHAGQVANELDFALDLTDYDGMTLNNMIVDCLDIDTLTADEEAALKQAFDSGFIIFGYEASEPCVVKLMADILDHPLIFDELTDLNVPEDISTDVFVVELHGDHIWYNDITFSDGGLMIDEDDANPEPAPGNGDDDDEAAVTPDDPDFPNYDTFQVHSSAIKEIIDTYDVRRDVLEGQGMVVGLDDFDDLNMTATRSVTTTDPLFATSNTSQPTGTLAEIAASYIHTHTHYVRPPNGTDDHNNSSYTGTYQMSTYVWSITASGPSGTFSYLMIAQDFNLSSAGLYRRTGSRDKGWYLRQFTNTNRLKSGGSYLSSNQAFLLDNDPASVSQETSSETHSTSFGISGDISTDGPSVGASADWSNSITTQKADVGILNNALSSNTGNDATWTYTALRPDHRDAGGLCTWDHLSEPAALARSNYQPSQTYIYRISPSFADSTITLESRWAVSVERMTLSKCTKLFSCYSCGSQNWTYTDNLGTDPDSLSVSASFNMGIHLPALP
ncbi:MAG: hypothetical protein AAF462_04930 [Thermodesulfobacteriota bacterium]